MDPRFASEFRRCLIEADVLGIMRVWQNVAPHMAQMPPQEALLALHMARVEAKSIPRELKLYSLALLAERGIERSDGKWVKMPTLAASVAESVGIASHSADPVFAKKIVRAMTDALLNGFAKGITEPARQREVMLKARDKVRFKAARA